MIIPENINLFQSIFKGREDVFAIRWEKGNKSGYMPAYYFDPYMYKVYKMKGGTFQNYTDKKYLKLTNEQIIKHLNGEQHIGIYPLLLNNTSWFIAADFDKENWVDECRTFLSVCEDKNIPAYLERSRSGKGGHVWIFFEEAYPATKSRKICVSILQQIGIFSLFDKTSSFDRLFPNQDYHSGKGLGNLIALPLHKTTVSQGNNCFIDSETLMPYNDQWTFLKNLQKAPTAKLDELYQLFVQPLINNKTTQQLPDSKLVIALQNNVYINRSAIPISLINFLKEELNFINTEFIIKKKVGKNTFGIERYFKFVEEEGDTIIIPKGFIGKLLRFCIDNKIEYTFQDNRKKLPNILLNFNTALHAHQLSIVKAIEKKDIGVIVAPPGSGKTIIGLKIIAQKQQPALIVVHRKQLMEQWIERTEAFLGIPKHEIGKVGQGQLKIGKNLTIATIQTLTKKLEGLEKDKLIGAFGTIIVDECHHISAETFRGSIAKLNNYYLYGLTATPFRKYNDGKLIFIHLGEVIAEVKPENIGVSKQPKIIIRNTELNVPFNSKTDNFETISKILIHDSARNKLILEDIANELKAGNKVAIITERKEHIDSLYQYLKQSYEVITLSGDDSENSRASKWKILREGSYQVLITTGQFFGEGTDLQHIHCLFLVYPFSFKGKLIQYIGRVQRSEITPTIYDYRDIKIEYLNKLFLNRNIYYRKLQKHASLFDSLKEESMKDKELHNIDQIIKFPLEELEFYYGCVAFKYFVTEIKSELQFEIDNDNIRPEFEVLKPYFAKALKSKNITIHIQAEFGNGKLVSQIATSNDIERIDQELIDGVKFKFITKDIMEGSVMPRENENILDLNQIQSNKPFYGSAKELLDNIVKHKKVKHYKQLIYLSEKHADYLLKIRFVLNPFSFSFLFLLMGDKEHHIVLETLDTEEATYMWHFNKDVDSLQSNLKEIDDHLSIICNKGRQAFIEMNPKNFSRIVHDYTDEKRGFIIWKGLLEERLI